MSKIILDNINFKYINLDNRPDRKAEVENELLKVNITAERFSAINKLENDKIIFPKTYTDGNAGCVLSHFNLLETYNSDKILGILEDDVVFCDDFKERFDYIEKEFDLEWDMFFLSSFYHLNDDKQRWNENGDYEFTGIKYIHRTYGSFCTHAYLVNPKSIEKILKLCHEHLDKSYAIDHLYILIQPFLNVYAFTPGMANQRISYSNISNNIKDQNIFLKTLGQHYYINNLKDFDYDEYFNKNK